MRRRNANSHERHRTARINRIIKDGPCDFLRAPRTHQINVDTCEKPPENCVHRLAQSHVADEQHSTLVLCSAICVRVHGIRLCVCIGPSWCCNVYIFYLSRTTNPLSFSAHNVQHYTNTHTPSATKSLEAFFLLFGFFTLHAMHTMHRLSAPYSYSARPAYQSSKNCALTEPQ